VRADQVQALNGTKKPLGQAAAKQHAVDYSELKDAANRPDSGCEELKQLARFGDEPLRALLRAFVAVQGNKRKTWAG
jgi:hypothetical protein